jgi:hypothetical protein
MFNNTTADAFDAIKLYIWVESQLFIIYAASLHRWRSFASNLAQSLRLLHACLLAVVLVLVWPHLPSGCVGFIQS